MKKNKSPHFLFSVSSQLTAIFIFLVAVPVLQAGWGDLVKQVAKEAAKDAAKEKVKEEIFKALTKNSDEYNGPKTYEEASALAMEIGADAAAGNVVVEPINLKKDMANAKFIKKLKKKSDRVAVVGFRVAFITSNAASASEDNSFSNLGNSTASRTGIKTIYQDQSIRKQLLLQGVDYELMQQITDHAYADFMEKLQASGLEVIPAEDILGSETFQSLDKSDSNPHVKHASMFRPQDVHVFSARDLPLWFSHLDAQSFGNVGPMSLKNWKKLNALSATTGAILLVPQITINFAEMQSSGRRTKFKKAKVSTENGIQLVPQHTYLFANYAKAKIAGDPGSVSLRKKREVPGEFAVSYLIDESDNATTVNMITRFTGQPGTVTKAETWAVVANINAYSALALAGTAAANDVFIASLSQ